MWSRLLAETATATPWWQYGVLGGLVALLLPFAWSAYKDQRDRANRLEQELREQNKIIQEKLVTELTRATEAIAQTLERRKWEREP